MHSFIIIFLYNLSNFCTHESIYTKDKYCFEAQKWNDAYHENKVVIYITYTQNETSVNFFKRQTR